MWRRLGYTIHLRESEFIELQFECHKTASIVTELGVSRFNRLKQIQWDIQYQTPAVTLHATELIDMVNYLMSSTYHTLQDKYPLIFSSYPRHMISLNYQFIKRTVLEVTSASFTNSDSRVQAEVNSDDLIVKYLVLLQSKSTTESSLLQIMSKLNKKRSIPSKSSKHVKDLSQDDIDRLLDTVGDHQYSGPLRMVDPAAFDQFRS